MYLHDSQDEISSIVGENNGGSDPVGVEHDVDVFSCVGASWNTPFASDGRFERNHRRNSGFSSLNSFMKVFIFL